MIVSCPSCGTRYHHHSQSAGEAAAARCSCCDDMVPLVVAGRPYLILPTSAAEQAGMAIGMDDPRLADQLARTALNAGSEEMPRAISYRIAPDEAVRAAKAGSRARRFSGANGSAPAIFDKRRSWLVSSKTRGRPTAAGRDRARPAATAEQSGRKALEVGIAAVLTVVGATTAYFSAVEQGLNPLTWVVAGGGLGLFMAWICLKWTR
jgi:predicted ribosomally synthesized peptide with SipW-like signal peptide